MAEKKPTVGIIGVGNIGRTLYTKLVNQEGWNVLGVIDVDGIYTEPGKTGKISELNKYPSFIRENNLMFLAIPTLDNGETARDYINSSLELRVPIVTCEKGALGNNFAQFEESMNSGMLGYNASVSGGARLLEILRARRGRNIKQIHAVLNGTLNYIFDGLSHGESLGALVARARRLGYAEPGATDPLDVINGEVTGDVPKKAAILFNVFNVFPSKRIKALDIDSRRIERGELEHLLRHAVNRRYIVSITPHDYKEEDVLWGFKVNTDHWCLSAGFKHVDDHPLYKNLIVPGVENALLTLEGAEENIYLFRGPGAGPDPTTDSMIADAKNILHMRD